MITTTILTSCFALIAVFAAVLVAFAPAYEAPRACLLCIGLWLGSVGIALFVLAAHPQWVNP